MATQSVRLEIPIGPNIVRAWFDTVVAPLLDGLGAEGKKLREDQWGWEPRPPVLRSAHELRDFLDVRAWKNLDQIFEFLPDIQVLAEQHDHYAKDLRSRFTELQSRLEESSALSQAYRRAEAGVRSKHGESQDRVLDSTDKPSHLIYLASYVINGYRRLYSHYLLSPIWNEFNQEFLSIRQQPPFAESIHGIHEVSEEFLKVIQELEGRLDKLWRALSIEHDVPFYPSSEFLPAAR